MKNALVIVTIVLLTIGCASQAEQPSASAAAPNKSVEAARVTPAQPPELTVAKSEPAISASAEPRSYDGSKEPVESWNAPKVPGKLLHRWQYVSENSATLYWQSENPSTSYIEYGETSKYGLRTGTTTMPPREFFTGIFDRPYYTQFHRLRGLEPDKTYHYRIISMGRNGTKVFGQDQTLATKKIEGAIYFPAEDAESPYILDKSDVTYILTKDIRTGGTAIIYAGKGNVTIDLNGHTVTYNKFPSGEPVHGVQVKPWWKKNVKLVNGNIVQGWGKTAKSAPIRARAADGMEVAGIEATWIGPDCHGIDWREARNCFNHHNVFFDKGTKITNRHQGLDVVHGGVTSMYNLVRRARHRGLQGKVETAFNEIYMDTWATNARACSGLKPHDNKIFGTGYMVQGVAYGWGDDTEPKEIYNNHIELVGGEVSGRSREYGADKPYCNLAGLRVTMYDFKGENFNFHDNTVIIHGKYATKMRGIWLSPTMKTSNIVFKNNYIKTVAYDTTVLGGRDSHTSVSISGSSGEVGDQAPSVFEGNTFVSNICNVRFAESYGAGCNIHLLNNKFVRLPGRDDYRTAELGWWVCETFGNIFRDTTFGGGASFEDIVFKGGKEKLTGKDAEGSFGKLNARRDFTVEWTLSVTTAPGAQVRVKDTTGQDVFDGVTDAEGKLSVPLAQYKMIADGDKGAPARKEVFTPHTVTVTSDGKTVLKNVTMDAKKDIEFPL